MARNTLSDLNNHLFAQMERLGDESISPEELKVEIDRSKAINVIARNIIDNAKLTLDAVKYSNDNLPSGKSIPEQFRLKE